MEEKRAGGSGDLSSKVAGLEVEIASLKRLSEEVDRRYEQRFIAQEQAVAAALTAAEKAVLVAERNSEKWRDQANEWRSSMLDREKTFAKDETLKSIANQVAELNSFKSTMQGRMWGIPIMIGIVVFIATQLLRFLPSP